MRIKIDIPDVAVKSLLILKAICWISSDLTATPGMPILFILKIYVAFFKFLNQLNLFLQDHSNCTGWPASIFTPFDH